MSYKLTGRWLMRNLVFFFKRKTAYEWRISDWGSGVCSSDLTHIGQREPALALRRPRQERLARGGEALFATADAPALLGRDRPLRRILQQVGCLGRPHGGVVDRLVTKGPTAHASRVLRLSARRRSSPRDVSYFLPSMSPERAAMNASCGTDRKSTRLNSSH